MAISPPDESEIEAFRTLGSIENIASLLGTTQNRLVYHLYSKSRPRYKIFTLAKASGGHRTIASPPKVVRAFQRKLLQCMTAIVQFKDPVNGFVPGRGVVRNATFHKNKSLILNIDIKDFFDSIHFGRVRGVFLKPPFSFPSNVAAVLAEICCLNSIIPQGAPTSPILTNLICRRLDRDLGRLARKNGCQYTRYADDITFSSNNKTFDQTIVAHPPIQGNPLPTLGEELLQIFQNHDFKINEKKLHLRRNHQHQEVTGLVVNRKVNVPRSFIRNLRAKIHDCEKKGVIAADARFRNGLDKKQRRGSTSPSLAEHIRGKLDYLRMVRGSDDPLYSKIALRAHQAFKLFKYGVPISGEATNDLQLLEAAIWIVLGKDQEGNNVITGTAFSLQGIGIVSCGHVFKSQTQTGYAIQKWEILQASDPCKNFQATEINQHSHIDLAIIHTNNPYNTSLQRAKCNIKTSEPLTVIGFPEWNTVGDKIFRDPGLASQTKPIQGINYILTNRHLREGNSGGPILDAEGRVIGVVAYDSTNPGAPNSGIGIEHIDEVKATQRKAL